MIEAIACAKINLSLRVGSVGVGGLHRIDGIFQSIGWVDHLQIDHAERDSLQSRHGGEVIAGWDNLAWQALVAVREQVGSSAQVEIILDKTIPAAAGLGGGSADAAASLALSGKLLNLDRTRLAGLAVGLGSDVPFCFRGGTIAVGGTGAELSEMPAAAGFAVAVVAPPIELATGDVYSRWDALDEPTGPPVAGSDLPPALRAEGPLINDLYPAAAAAASSLEDWRAELADRWGRPVLMTGSGPTLFAFFVDEAEARGAVEDTPAGARAKAAALPVPFGWAMRDGDQLTASVSLDETAEDLVRSLLTVVP